jgi:hypothetical protein
MSLKCFFNKKIINKKIKPILLRINDAYCTHQFLIGELLLQFKNQTYKIMWTLNLDNFKSCHLIITCSLNEHSHKRTFFMQLILLAHQVKNHKLDICYKINPPHNQQLFIDVFVQVQECFESFYTVYFFFYSNTCYVAILALGLRPRQGLARVWAKREIRKLHLVLLGM